MAARTRHQSAAISCQDVAQQTNRVAWQCRGVVRTNLSPEPRRPFPAPPVAQGMSPRSTASPSIDGQQNTHEQPDQSNMDIVRKATRELTRKFDYG
jgi:hypothetical protein